MRTVRGRPWRGSPARCRAITSGRRPDRAGAIAARHQQLREQDPAVGPLPAEAHLGVVYAVRQLACDALEDGPDADLSTLIGPTVEWIAATVAGARLSGARRRPP